MEKFLSRISFGLEPELALLSTRCPGCDAKLGQYHNFGCPLEICPFCAGPLLKCNCGVLSFHDEYQTTKAVARIMNIDWARCLLEKSPYLENSLEENGAFMWLIENRPIELFGEMEVLAEKSLYDMTSCGITIEEELGVENLYPGWETQTIGPKH